MGKSKAKLIEGEVGRTLVNLTIPMLLAVLTMVAFNIVDTYFVGQLGKVELAAMGFTIAIVMLIGSLSQGLGVGVSAVIARAIGEGDFAQVQRLATDGILLALAIVIPISGIGLLTIEPLFTLLGADAEVMPFIRQYMSIWYFGVMFVVVPMVGNATIRATGDMKTPAMIMFFAVGVNITLDPLLIFGYWGFPALGIQGAALATVIARIVTTVAALYVLIKREQMITFVRPSLGELLESWRKILFIGIPAAGTAMLVPISTGVITGLVAGYGNAAVAAYGVGSRLELLALAVVMALSSTLTPFVAQNWGAGKMDRVRLAVRYSVMFAAAWGVGFAILAALFGDPVARIFNEDADVRQVIVTFLLIVPVSYAGQGTLLVASATLNALNRPLHATALMALRLFGLYIPLAAVGAWMIGLNGVFGAATVANFAVGIAAWVWVVRVMGRDGGAPASDLGGAVAVGGD